MGVEYMARQIYQDVVARVTRTEADWKAVCRLAGQIYRYEFDNVLIVYAQNPSATLVADYDTWKKVHRYVKRGSRGIAVFPSRAPEGANLNTPKRILHFFEKVVAVVLKFSK